jgi:GNAT superfamily N-acetyltransferase
MAISERGAVTAEMAGEWRAMRADDLDSVLALADRSHPGLPEGRAVFAERLALFPKGCLVLDGGHGIGGYTVSHPIRRSEPPALGALLGSLSADADQFYIHDVVVEPPRRSSGAATAAVARLLDLASDFDTTALVSVYGTVGFWSRFGFAPSPEDMAEKLRPYGADAVYLVRPNRT